LEVIGRALDVADAFLARKAKKIVEAEERL
jgi:hypothetical protein